jgi:hypothetical protein
LNYNIKNLIEIMRKLARGYDTIVEQFVCTFSKNPWLAIPDHLVVWFSSTTFPTIEDRISIDSLFFSSSLLSQSESENKR